MAQKLTHLISYAPNILMVDLYQM